MTTINVRYIVHDVKAAIAYYTEHLGFELKANPAPGFAMLARDGLHLLVNVPGAGGAGQGTPDGRMPEPGGWNRFQIEVHDLDALVDRMRSAGARFRGEIVTGRGGRQILAEDPSGNPIELFEPPAS